MERRLLVFVTVFLLLALVNSWLMPRIAPPPPAPLVAAEGAAKPASKPPEMVKADTKHGEASAIPAAKPATEPVAKTAKAPSNPAEPVQWLTLGSADPKSGYRMLATLSNQGAAVARIELSSPRYRDIENRSGYLGHVALTRGKRGEGCPVDVVGPGTPAAEAGLKAGDHITQVGGQTIENADDLDDYLDRTSPGQSVGLLVIREGKPLTLGPVKLGWRPLEVVKPEGSDPLSYLLTLRQLDQENLGDDEKTRVDNRRELPGVDLRTANWSVAAADGEHVVFEHKLAASHLVVTKTYRLEKVPEAELRDDDYKAYHLVFELGFRNGDSAAHQFTYQLDGPTGLPAEGAWYAYKSWTGWGAVGLRDAVVCYPADHFPTLVDCSTIADDKAIAVRRDDPLSFIGVDAQYFSAELVPQPAAPTDIWFSGWQPIRVGEVDPAWKKKTNTSCRLFSVEESLKPDATLSHKFLLFAGPKKPSLLAQYGLEDLVYYGWFAVVAKPMVWLLHALYAVVRNYGIAIVLLTVIVRLAMFPVSRKQALGMIKMQQIQPELQKLKEKYKGNVEAMTKAQNELFAKHNYNPLSGCLLVFIQLPIFLALYRTLNVDVALRQAPLLSESIRWCSNLAGPDMLYDWSAWGITLLSPRGVGMFALGPYFNILPIFTILLFLWQQKKMMPPPADEQAAMQQKMMQFMMIFMGLMFFKVASGLCIYFIASTLWGMGERQFLPKVAHATPEGGATPPRPERPRNDGRDKNRKKSRR